MHTIYIYHTSINKPLFRLVKVGLINVTMVHRSVFYYINLTSSNTITKCCNKWALCSTKIKRLHYIISFQRLIDVNVVNFTNYINMAIWFDYRLNPHQSLHSTILERTALASINSRNN
jgi:hypothetical protein